MFEELKQAQVQEVLRSPEFSALFPQQPTDEEILTTLFECTTHGKVWVTDDETAGHSIYVFDTNGVNKDKLLAVTNQSGHSVYLWKIDGVMFKRFSKCDCALIHDDVLHLIEFKANAKNESDASIEGNYIKASTQLMLTLNYLKDSYAKIGADIDDVFSDIDAQIVFDRIVPQNNSYQKSVSKKFLDENTVILTFGNSIKTF